MMWQQLVEFVQGQLQTNNFLSGGAVLMVLGALAASMRKVPENLWNWSVERIFMVLEVPDNDEAFKWVNKWLAAHPYSKNRARSLTVRTEKEEGENGNRQPPRIILSPSPGTHWLIWRRRFVILTREHKDGPSAGESDFESGKRQRELFHLKILTFNRQLVSELVLEARDLAIPKNDDRITVYVPRYRDWDGDLKVRSRPIESVILRPGVMDSLAKQIDNFLTRQQWYLDRGIPWRWGCLLYGPPGNGKSSTVMALAGHLKLDIAILNLAAASLDDDELRQYMSKVPDRCIVLIEDIDCIFNQREATEDKGNRVTFSGLLNAIDGVVASEGRILIMTTNFPNKLDEALIRPGRCDGRILIDNADAAQSRKMYQRFFPDAPEHLANEFSCQLDKPVSMAAIQGHFLKHSDDPHAASTNAADIYHSTPRSTDEQTAEDAAAE